MKSLFRVGVWSTCLFLGGTSACKKSPPPAPAPHAGAVANGAGTPAASADSENVVHKPATHSAPPPAPLALPDDEKVRAAISELIARYDALQALSATVELQISEALGQKGKTKGKGEFMLRQAGDKKLTKFRVNNHLTFEKLDAAGTLYHLNTQELVWQIYDGDYLWLLFKQHKLNKAIKTHYHPDKVWKVGGRELFREILDESELTLLPDEELDGHTVFVFSVKPHDGDWTGKQWFDKKTGARLKVIEVGADGKESFSIVLSDIKDNPELAADTFVFTLPEGYELTDEVNPPPPGAESKPQPSDADSATKPGDAAPKPEVSPPQPGQNPPDPQ